MSEKYLTYAEKLAIVEKEDEEGLPVVIWTQCWTVLGLLHPALTAFVWIMGGLALVSTSMSRDRHYRNGPAPWTISVSIFTSGLISAAIQWYAFTYHGAYISVLRLFGIDL